MIDLDLPLGAGLDEDALSRLCKSNHQSGESAASYKGKETTLLQSVETLTYAFDAAFFYRHNHGSDYSEIAFNPHNHLENGLTPKDVIDSAIAGLEMAKAETKKAGQLLLEADDLSICELALSYQGKGIAGVVLKANQTQAMDYCLNKSLPFILDLAGEKEGKIALRYNPARIKNAEEALNDRLTKSLVAALQTPIEVSDTPTFLSLMKEGLNPVLTDGLKTHELYSDLRKECLHHQIQAALLEADQKEFLKEIVDGINARPEEI